MARRASAKEPEEAPPPDPAPAEGLTSAGKRLLIRLRQRLAGDQVLFLEIQPFLAEEWHEVDGGIEAVHGSRTCRVDPADKLITISHHEFSGTKRLPL